MQKTNMQETNMSRIAARTSFALLAVMSTALFTVGCEPAAKPVDASQVRPEGSAPTNEPGHTVKFDSNQSANAPAGVSGAATPK